MSVIKNGYDCYQIILRGIIVKGQRVEPHLPATDCIQ